MEQKFDIDFNKTNGILKNISVNISSAVNSPSVLLTYIALVILFIFYQLNFLPFLDGKFEIKNISPELKLAYITTLHFPSSLKFSETFKLMEDNKLLGPANILHADIRNVGNGGYNITGNTLRFSTIDNTSLANHTFTIQRPYGINKYLFYLIILSMFFVLGRLYFLKPYATEKILLCTLRITPWLAFIFISTDIINNIFFPKLVKIAGDTGLFVGVAQQFLNGEIPFLGYGAPLYPFILAAIKVVTHSASLANLYVVSVQYMFCFLSAITLMYAVYKWSPLLALVAVWIIYTCWFTHIDLTVYNAYILSDSILASLLMFCVAFLILCLHPNNKPRHWILFSLSIALAILTKPVAEFILPIGFLTLIYMFFNFRSWRKIFSLVLPLSLILSGLLTYNFLVGGFLGFSEVGIYDLSGTLSYGLLSLQHLPTLTMQKSANEVRNAIIAHNGKEGLKLLATSWDREKMIDLYTYSFSASAVALTKNSNEEAIRLGILDKARSINNGNYVKVVVRNFMLSHDEISIMNRDYVNNRLKEIAYFSITHAPMAYIKFVTTSLRTMYFYVFGYKNGYPWLWEILFLCVNIHALWHFIKNQGRSIPAFLVLSLSLYFISYTLVVCLVQIPEDRYVYILNYLPFLIIALYPLLFYKKYNFQNFDL